MKFESFDYPHPPIMISIPCEDCITLPVCKAESYNYDTWLHTLNPETVQKCCMLQKYYSLRDHKRIRYFFRPDLIETDIIKKDYLTRIK